MRKTAVVLACAALAIGVASAPGCTIANVCSGHLNDAGAPSSLNYCGGDSNIGDPGPPCQGHLLDPYTWESVAVGGVWLSYDAELQYNMFLVDATTGNKIQGRPSEVTVYVSASNQPESCCDRFAEAAGNLATIHIWCSKDDVGCETAGPRNYFWDPPRVDVLNDTCAKYFVKVIVRAEPVPAAADAASDAPSDTGGG